MGDWNGRDGDGFSSNDGGAAHHRPLEVRIGERGLEGALRLFKRLVLRDGLLRDLKRRSHYEKPGDRRRRKARESLRRLRKQRNRALKRGEQVEE
jgi:small subunit ribosomal protein S21